MHSSKAIFLLLALSAAAVQAQTKTTDVVAALNKNGNKLGAAILEIANVHKPAGNSKAKYTLLLPTEAAIQAFLKDMGLTVDDLKKRPLLAKALVRQHVLLRSNVREQDIFDKGNTRKAATLASVSGQPDVTFTRTAPGKVTVTDPQGNTANIVGKPIFLDDNKTVHSIDKVLLGGDYYTSFDAVCKHRADRVSQFCSAVKTAGLGSALDPKKLDATVFVPNNKAFAAATAAAKPSAAQLTNILKYHVVPGAKELPKGWKGGASFPTLLGAGNDLKVEYSKVKAVKGKYDYAEAKVIPASGTGVPVLKSNVHVGKAIVHGIGSVLVPGAKPSTTTEAAAPAKKTTTNTGRRLLEFGWGMSAGPTAEMDDAESAIQAAVAGNESVAAAADQSTLGAEELSVPGDYNQVVNGINPW